MAGTLILAVRQTLLDGLAELPAFTTPSAKGHKPLVTLGFPLGKKDREKVFTARARFAHQPASLRAGRTFRNEQGQFELTVWIEGVGESQEWTTGRATTLGLAVEEYVADNRTLGGAVPGLNAIKVEGEGDLAELFNDRGTLAVLTYPIQYDARLT